MNFLLIGNIIALVASILMVISGIVKEKKRVIFYQTLEVGIAVIAYIFLNAMSGVIINAINLVRNYLCYKNNLNISVKIIISILSILLVLYFNNDGLIGILPLICIIVWIWTMTIKDVIIFKTIFASIMILWTIYDFKVQNYVACVFDILTMLANIISIISIKYSKKIK